MSQKGSTRNSLILLCALLVNAVVIGLGGYYVWKATKKERADFDAAQTAIEKEKAPEEIKSANEKTTKEYFKKVIPFESLLTNLAGDGGRRFLRVSLEVEFEGEKVLQEVAKLRPQIRDAILVAVTELSFEEANKPQGRETLKQNILRNINELLHSGKAKDLYFTDYQTN